MAKKKKNDPGVVTSSVTFQQICAMNDRRHELDSVATIAKADRRVKNDEKKAASTTLLETIDETEAEYGVDCPPDVFARIKELNGLLHEAISAFELADRKNSQAQDELRKYEDSIFDLIDEMSVGNFSLFDNLEAERLAGDAWRDSDIEILGLESSIAKALAAAGQSKVGDIVDLHVDDCLGDLEEACGFGDGDIEHIELKVTRLLRLVETAKGLGEPPAGSE